jgi:hypothetical protein
LADAPKAIGTIAALIGSDKLAEEEERKLLERDQNPLAIPDLRANPPDDDEIPF